MSRVACAGGFVAVVLFSAVTLMLGQTRAPASAASVIRIRIADAAEAGALVCPNISVTAENSTTATNPPAHATLDMVVLPCSRPSYRATRKRTQLLLLIFLQKPLKFPQ